MKKDKKQNAISKHFSELGKKSWAKRKANILKRAKVEVEKSNIDLG